MKDVKLEVGELVTLGWGEYSDKQWVGPLKMLVAKTQGELVAEFVKEAAAEDVEYGYVSGGTFTAWLIKKRYAEDVTCRHWQLEDEQLPKGTSWGW